MNTKIGVYIEDISSKVYAKISADLKSATINSVVEIDLVKRYFGEEADQGFYAYYFKILENETGFISNDFFKQFKQLYSLQGIDNNYLDGLEIRKTEILKQIKLGNLFELYAGTFREAVVKSGEKDQTKELGSFFAKLVHTFRPNEYCAFDNLVKNYLGLNKESFFISYMITCHEYKRWASENQELMVKIRKKFKEADADAFMNHEKLSEMKILDLIFWSKGKSMEQEKKEKIKAPKLIPGK